MSTNPFIQAAVNHFKAAALSIVVPEWKVDGQPITIFYSPLTVDERSALFKGEGAVTKGDADILIMKAKTKEGKPMFTLEDKPALLQYVDSAVVLRIARAMIRGAEGDAGKN
jgi:hypothetical protein